MRIRDVNRNVNANQLGVIRNGDDVCIFIYENGGNDRYGGRPVYVKIGMAGSGMCLPGKLDRIIGELADEFDKYADCDFESDGVSKDLKEMRWEKIIGKL